MDRNEAIEIPFGAKDSELKGWEYTIPEGMEAEIKNDKIIVREKESEDEGIIRTLKEIVNWGCAKNISVENDVELKDCLAWLEKQCEHIKFLKSIQIGDEVTRNPDGVLVNLSQFKRKAEQGSQNLANSSKTCKIEPKFKVGDWIADIYCKGKIIELTDDSYLLDTGQGIPFSCEHNTHLWTIQDAKVGDVLYSKKGCGAETIDLVSGWKKVDGENSLCSACTYRIEDDEILTGGLGAIWWDGVQDPFCPATKEQCVLLFQKMKEAGYEWDAEKKELRKIEQNPAWSEEDEKIYQSIMDDTIQENQLDKKQTNWLRNIKYRYFPQPKQEWSEEDKEALRVVTNIFEQHGVKLLCYPGFVHWLKTLPNRITFNPYWKPSDEQMNDLEYIMKYYPNIRGMVNSIYTDLKKLKG